MEKKHISYKNLRVEAAAIKDIDGKIWTLPPPNRHHDVIRLMRESGYEGPVSHPDQQGFILNNGIFCRLRAARFTLLVKLKNLVLMSKIFGEIKI
jgi:hypothetical protein